MGSCVFLETSEDAGRQQITLESFVSEMYRRKAWLAIALFCGCVHGVSLQAMLPFRIDAFIVMSESYGKRSDTFYNEFRFFFLERAEQEGLRELSIDVERNTPRYVRISCTSGESEPEVLQFVIEAALSDQRLTRASLPNELRRHEEELGRLCREVISGRQGTGDLEEYQRHSAGEQRGTSSDVILANPIFPLYETARGILVSRWIEAVGETHEQDDESLRSRQIAEQLTALGTAFRNYSDKFHGQLDFDSNVLQIQSLSSNRRAFAEQYARWTAIFAWWYLTIVGVVILFMQFIRSLAVRADA